ncbi:competence protein ComK [Bacillus sp. 165]|uniref:competence protein ComK n=1 Tax=Bacillus sp. 165 TaxID=1529117 RepID=UPI001AD9AD11|nr:competence protein ComK [Bacillus sp. 165]MBO9129991.1 competence protein ComK [Bacillus sp. 165]
MKKYAAYTISESTIALLPYTHMEYQTKILDEKGWFYSKQTCWEVIKESCVRDGATYSGKRDAIKSLFSYKQNIPILIDKEKRICAIPSKSPERWDCTWFFYAHVTGYEQHDNTTLLHFRNGQQFQLDSTYYTTKQQLHKAAHIIAYFQLQK